MLVYAYINIMPHRLRLNLNCYKACNFIFISFNLTHHPGQSTERSTVTYRSDNWREISQSCKSCTLHSGREAVDIMARMGYLLLIGVAVIVGVAAQDEVSVSRRNLIYLIYLLHLLKNISEML